MDTEKYGGVTAKDVIIFQTKIMMGAQFGRILWAKEHITKDLNNSQNEILIACLRMGWNDAFRHTSENEEGINNTIDSRGAVSAYEKKDKYKKPILKLFRGRITEKYVGADFDDYFSYRVISTKEFIDIFKEFAESKTDKYQIIASHWEEIKTCFKGVKKLDGNKSLSFGHIQKMFNIAIKLYLCLYICREELGLDDDVFIQEIVNNFAYADCPIDSIILEKLEQTVMKRVGTGKFYDTTYGNYTWSRLEHMEYNNIQENIKKESKGNSNLWFDFDNWN